MITVRAIKREWTALARLMRLYRQTVQEMGMQQLYDPNHLGRETLSWLRPHYQACRDKIIPTKFTPYGELGKQVEQEKYDTLEFMDTVVESLEKVHAA